MRISRRHFCAAVGLGLAARCGPLAAADDQTLRVIAYNVYGGTGWPPDRSRAQQAVAGGQMARRLALELALYNPDIVSFSESPGEELTKEVADMLGMHHVRFPSGGNWPGTLLSRFELFDVQNVPLSGGRPPELFTRHWGRGTVRLPSGELLTIHSAHLFPTADPTIRLREVAAMLSSMESELSTGHPMLLIGDLNHNPDTEEYRLWQEAGWVDTFAQVGQGSGFTIRSDTPEWRIDYVWAAGPIAARVVEARPLFEGAFRLNLADDQSFALSDHLPQLAVFRMGP